jgi:hypothetical protein
MDLWQKVKCFHCVGVMKIIDAIYTPFKIHHNQGHVEQHEAQTSTISNSCDQTQGKPFLTSGL